MDYRKLRYFRAVAEAKSFHQASEALRVSQPALTRAIKELEADLGTLLFARHSRGVDLTREGVVLLGHADRLIRDADKARNAVMALGTRPKGLVSVGVPPSLSVLLLADVAKEISDKYPDIVLNFHERLMPDLLDMMMSDRLDIAIVGNPRQAPGVSLQPLVEEEVILVGTTKFDLPSTLPLKDLGRFPLIVTGSGMNTFSWLEEALKDRATLQATKFRVESPALSIALAETGLACAVLPRSTLIDPASHRRLKSCRIKGVRLQRFLATNAVRSQSPGVSAVLDVVKSTFARLIQQEVFGRPPR